MLAYLIFNYLAAHEGKGSACLIYHADGEMSVMNFQKKDQQVELMRQNKWLASNINYPEIFIEINGDQVIDLGIGENLK
ncbi:MAG TPA: hypothetical protein VK787_13475 [Puia sp.]|jgi:hypothetical protein|nr:hypothetical protein [Puia sp.]